MRKEKSRSGMISTLVTLVLFGFIFAAMVSGTAGTAGTAGEEGIRAAREAIERTVVLCYATEGFYPPSLSYMEARYGLQIDRQRYSVRYEVFATNVTPTVEVIARGS